MDRDRLRGLLEAVKNGSVAPENALETLSVAPYVEATDSRIDVHRALRQGLPEVVFGAGKTPRQIAGAARTLVAHGQPALVTRVGPEAAAEVLSELPSGEYVADARLLWFGPAAPAPKGRGTIVVVCAGTADLPVAREACEVARRFGNKVELVAGVADSSTAATGSATPGSRRARSRAASATGRSMPTSCARSCTGATSTSACTRACAR